MDKRKQITRIYNNDGRSIILKISPQKIKTNKIK